MTTKANVKDLRTHTTPMQSRHFATIAAILRTLPADADPSVTIAHFANKLAGCNPNFNVARFVAACLAENADV